VSLLLQLASAFDDSGLTSADGSVQYLRAQHPLTTPTLLVSPLRIRGQRAVVTRDRNAALAEIEQAATL